MRTSPPPADIWSAAATGDLEVLQSLLAPEAEVDVDVLDDWGRSALMVAAMEGQTGAVQCLVEHGANAALQDDESGYSSLHRALLRCHLAVAAILVRAGAPMDAPLDREGLSPIDLLTTRFGAAPSDPDVNVPAFGDVLTWGAAGGAALGRGVTGSSHFVGAGRVEIEVPFLSAVAAAKHHMLLVDSEGEAHSCGLGVGGRLGHGDEKRCVVPRRLSLPRRVVCVAAGLNHSLAVDERGKVFSWGSESAPLGYEAAAPQLTPRRVRFGATPTKGVDEQVRRREAKPAQACFFLTRTCTYTCHSRSYR